MESDEWAGLIGNAIGTVSTDLIRFFMVLLLVKAFVPEMSWTFVCMPLMLMVALLVGGFTYVATIAYLESR